MTQQYPDFRSERRAGVLLHITSLPGTGNTGDLGSEAFHFINFLADCGMTWWQMLPIGPPQGGLSPYQTSSAHAGNPQLISLETLVNSGWLNQDALIDSLDHTAKKALLQQAYRGFNIKATIAERTEFNIFCANHAYWLEDYVLFRAISEQRQKSWWQWPKGLRTREKRALTQARDKLLDALNYIRWEQFIFFQQWTALHHHAATVGVRLFGDMPIFVAYDSAEVWARPQDFDLNPDGSLRVVAGVPPDYFSATGQRWGNPLYHWEQLEKSQFRFWIDRIRTQLKLFDLIRIDHFRGFEAYWEIPATEEYAIQGEWVKAGGDALFAALHREFGDLPLIAEDLGVITAEVDELRRKYQLPGMKVLQFAFDGSNDNIHLPSYHTQDSVVYTGTHDNDTTCGWYESLTPESRHYVYEYLGNPNEAMPWVFIRTAFASVANLAIIPLQDLLGLDGQHRMNLPGTSDGNWQWRFSWSQVDAELPARLRYLIKLYGRAAQDHTA
ncbi:4-alpha-glucanotransferase [Thiospirillum jenense]|uniref:4-alpha-glucanotransferase n=1 Tax=Thiospirillum jenense TaxID=1653858 RepID=A0A839HDI3_9GAMM|nr:4-alpha-glucanotransferase [Thiospirillum jenense]MBB1126995.1 4-alpha-glucanotransferase [Thiospirillum jenense]